MKKCFVSFLFACGAWFSFAQQTSTIEGRVFDEAGEPLPGVVLSIQSDALLGSRTEVSRANGVFLFRLIPPGRYNLTATMTGMQTVKQDINVGLGQSARPTVVMKPATTEETLVVTASVDPVLSTTSVTSHFEKDFVDKIANGRDQRSVAILAPGTNNRAFAGQISISGAPTHANIYLVNGVDSRFDNLRGGPANLVIEDAIQETTVFTSAISAEYGNFGGGVINSVTKSGGNDFSGSFRVGFSNEDWQARTPFEAENGIEKLDEVNQTYTATIGGPIIKDRIWFFGAFFNSELDRNQNFDTPIRLPDSVAVAYGLEPNQPIPNVRAIQGRGTVDERFEVKLTGRIAEGHDVVLSWQDKSFEDVRNGSSPLTEDALWPVRNIPVEGYSLNYRGLINDVFSVDLLYSDRESVFEERPTGHLQGDTRITGTLLRDQRSRGFWNSALFLGKPDEPRGNETLRAKMNYFLVTENLGSHDFVLGFEDFSDSRLADNRQSFNDWAFWSDVRYEGNTPIPIYSPTSADGRYRSRLVYFPIENPSIGSDLGSQAIFLNDGWTLNEKWRFNIGFRHEDREAFGEDGSLLVDDSSFSPRLSVNYDLHGDGKHGFSASYSEYVQRVGDGADNISVAGSPSFAWLNYSGPQTENYLDVIQWINDTYGQDFFFDPLNHPNTEAFLDDLTVNNLFDPAGRDTVLGAVNPNGGITPTTLASPVVEEIRLGYQYRIGNRGFLKGDYVGRDFDDFYISHINTLTGRSANGRADLEAINNDDEDYERTYHAVQLQGRYRFTNDFTLAGNYTWSQVYGNINGESGSGVSGTTSTTTAYPEFNTFDQRNPSGYLPNDQRHVARIFAVYELSTSIGDFSFAGTQRFETGTPFNKTVSLSLTGGRDVAYGFVPRTQPGYASPPTTTTYFIDPRGSNRAEDITQTDLGVTWELSIGRSQLFIEFDIFNLWNEDSAPNGNGYNTSTQRLDTFNVFTETPVEGTHFELNENFGTPNSNGAYQTPRTFRFDVGFRF